MWLVTLVLLINSWMDAGSILSLWALSTLETLCDITTNLVTTLLNPLDLGRRKEGHAAGHDCLPSGWILYFGLAIQCLFNAFLFYYDMTVAALCVINNKTVGTDVERRVLLLLCGTAVWYCGFQACFYYSKIFSPEWNILMPLDYEREAPLAVGGGNLDSGSNLHNLWKSCIRVRIHSHCERVEPAESPGTVANVVAPSITPPAISTIVILLLRLGQTQ